MTTYETPIVAGVFEEEIEARKAVDMLRSAQFERDQLGVAMRNGGSATESLSNDFMNLGVPHDRANFYEHEFQAGKIVVSVRPDGRDEEARTILHSNGAYDFDTMIAASQESTEAQSTDDAPAMNASIEQPPIEQDQPVQESPASSIEQPAIQEPANLDTTDTHAQSDSVEHATNESDTEMHTQSQDAEPLTHSTEAPEIASNDTTHEAENA